MEIRVPSGRKARWLRAAERSGISLSDWARRRLDEIAEEEIGNEEPPVPSDEDIKDALSVFGSLQGTGFRERVLALRKTPWTVE